MRRVMVLYHFNPKKDRPTACSARKGNCPFGDPEDPSLGHYRNLDEAIAYMGRRIEKEIEEREGRSSTSALLKEAPENPVRINLNEGSSLKGAGLIHREPLEGEFSKTNFYGSRSPRDVQVPALKAVIEDLEKEDNTQLIAACGTGKTYMGRQILSHFMNQEDSNGISVVLTSSIKLAQDTAADMRPAPGEGEGSYDGAFGIYGKDYEVIEVHSGKSGGRSVKEDGSVSVERIKAQLEAARLSGKKIVVVSTYDSSRRFQEAQEELGSDYQADLIMHDEAHNVLGQQVIPGNSQEVLNVYTGFHNSIPGAIQARKRLYTTATPIIRESESDNEPTGSIEEAIEQAKRIQAGERDLRVTFYSDAEAIVGKVSGYISQEEAIDSACLTRPDYQVRETPIKGDYSNFKDPVVDITGNLMERPEGAKDGEYLTARTYSAIDSTLSAMVADPEPGKNPTHNALVYTGSIDQSKAFKSNAKAIALAKSSGMTLEEAEAKQDSKNLEERNRARYRLLAEHLEVKAAHSGQDSESKREKAEAFEMFTGNSVRDSKWTPHKKALANVDIFSEGVSINEIDTVVMADDNKLSERAMTQAIGRAIRVSPGNSFKNTGHVIIPSAHDDRGNLHEGSIQQAIYGATRVERGIATKIVRGEPVLEDNKTSFTFYKKDGSKSETLASTYTKDYVKDSLDVLAVSVLDNTHKALMKDELSPYRKMNPNEQLEMLKTSIREKAETSKAKNKRREYSLVSEKINSYSFSDMEALKRKEKVVNSALASGDINALGEDFRNTLIKKGIVIPRDEVKTGVKKSKGPSIAEKRAFLERHLDTLTVAAYAPIPAGTPPVKEHQELHKVARLASSEDLMPKITGSYIMKGDDSAIAPIREHLTSYIGSDSFVETSYSLLTNEKKRSKIAALNSLKMKRRATMGTIDSDIAEMNEKVDQETFAEASTGKVGYTVNPDMIRKTGALRRDAINLLISEL